MNDGAPRSLNTLNFQHLLYFWTVAREGSIDAATRALELAQPTISGQIHTLERSLGAKLFERRGRGLVLTDVGRVVFRYADDMFSIGQELQDTLAGQSALDRPQRFTVGISDALPKLTAHRLLEPASRAPLNYRLMLRIGKTDAMLDALSAHSLDLVLSDTAAPLGRQRAYSHLLGQSSVTVFGVPALATRYRRGFPESLQDAPFVLHATNTAMRRSLDQCFAELAVRPQVHAEIEDVALLQVFGSQGVGLFAAPTAVEAQIRASYGVRVVGRLPGVTEYFYAISMERRLSHPAVLAIRDAAKLTLRAERR